MKTTEFAFNDAIITNPVNTAIVKLWSKIALINFFFPLKSSYNEHFLEIRWLCRLLSSERCEGVPENLSCDLLPFQIFFHIRYYRSAHYHLFLRCFCCSRKWNLSLLAFIWFSLNHWKTLQWVVFQWLNDFLNIFSCNIWCIFVPVTLKICIIHR